MRRFLLILFFLMLIGATAACGFGYYGYLYLTRDLPKMTRLEDFRPPAVSKVYARDGTLVAEFFRERRYPIALKDVPEHVRHAFLAAEDAMFYQHPGIDLQSIIRAMIKNIRTGHFKQGGSTITQQVVKNLLLSSERSLERKAKEALLAFQLESKLTKDEILEIYLNQIFLGNGAYGIRAAAQNYFHKEPHELTIAEAAMLAGLPQAPSRYSPVSNMRAAKRRQRYVLGQMEKSGFISASKVNESTNEPIKVFHESFSNIRAAPYYVTEVRKMLLEDQRFRGLNIDTDGLEIHTALDLEADKAATNALITGLKAVDKRRGWRGPKAQYGVADREKFLKEFSGGSESMYPALIEKINAETLTVFIPASGAGETATISYPNITWIRKRLFPDATTLIINPRSELAVGDVIEVSKNPEGAFTMDQTPEIEGCFEALDPHSGEVLAIVGGYSYARSVFNRVTQGLRQPGSSFKPLVYLSAIDGFSYTPASIVDDSPRTFRIGEEFWSPSNFDDKFFGQITLAMALEKSLNLVSADIVSRIGIEAPIRYARALGIESPLGRNLSLSLGSSEMYMFELVRAYGAIAAGGRLVPSTLVTKIIDRRGNLLFDASRYRQQFERQAISPQSAYVMTHMLRGVVNAGTATGARELGRPAAGKTGTSNDQMDAWFIGFTPSVVGGVWVGFDQKKSLGKRETGGRVSVPIWTGFMKEYLTARDKRAGSETPVIEDFIPPAGVHAAWMNKRSGVQAAEGEEGAVLEYFVDGTGPRTYADDAESAESYLSSPDF